ncbi:hypothetical protein HK102_010015 [Quaeritorhiza haematococci]|nr:hypothetical protein HK102_010015 [Quaeritorhiza haematococci]
MAAWYLDWLKSMCEHVEDDELEVRRFSEGGEFFLMRKQMWTNHPYDDLTLKFTRKKNRISFSASTAEPVAEIVHGILGDNGFMSAEDLTGLLGLFFPDVDIPVNAVENLPKQETSAPSLHLVLGNYVCTSEDIAVEESMAGLKLDVTDLFVDFAFIELESIPEWYRRIYGQPMVWEPLAYSKTTIDDFLRRYILQRSPDLSCTKYCDRTWVYSKKMQPMWMKRKKSLRDAWAKGTPAELFAIDVLDLVPPGTQLGEESFWSLMEKISEESNRGVEFNKRNVLRGCRTLSEAINVHGKSYSKKHAEKFWLSMPYYDTVRYDGEDAECPTDMQWHDDGGMNQSMAEFGGVDLTKTTSPMDVGSMGKVPFETHARVRSGSNSIPPSPSVSNTPSPMLQAGLPLHFTIPMSPSRSESSTSSYQMNLEENERRIVDKLEAQIITMMEVQQHHIFAFEDDLLRFYKQHQGRDLDLPSVPQFRKNPKSFLKYLTRRTQSAVPNFRRIEVPVPNILNSSLTNVPQNPVYYIESRYSALHRALRTKISDDVAVCHQLVEVETPVHWLTLSSLYIFVKDAKVTPSGNEEDHQRFVRFYEQTHQMGQCCAWHDEGKNRIRIINPHFNKRMRSVGPSASPAPPTGVPGVPPALFHQPAAPAVAGAPLYASPTLLQPKSQAGRVPFIYPDRQLQIQSQPVAPVAGAISPTLPVAASPQLSRLQSPIPQPQNQLQFQSQHIAPLAGVISPTLPPEAHTQLSQLQSIISAHLQTPSPAQVIIRSTPTPPPPQRPQPGPSPEAVDDMDWARTWTGDEEAEEMMDILSLGSGACLSSTVQSDLLYMERFCGGMSEVDVNGTCREWMKGTSVRAMEKTKAYFARRHFLLRQQDLF